MAKMFNILILPLELLKQPQFAEKISHINQNLTENLSYLQSMLQLILQTTHNNLTPINKQIPSIESQIVPVRNHNASGIGHNASAVPKESTSVLFFLSHLFEITSFLQNNVYKLHIFLKGRKYEAAARRMIQTIQHKLAKVGEKVNAFVDSVRQYNALGQAYIKKSQYFNGIQKNPVRYYSFEKTADKYQAIVKMENMLETRLDQIEGTKGQIRVMMIELSVKISQFYENVRLKIQQFRKIAQNMVEKVIQQIKKGLEKIEEASQGAQQSQIAQRQSIRKQPSNNFLQISIPDNSEVIKTSTKRSITIPETPNSNPIKNELKRLKKQKFDQFLQQVALQSHLLTLISAFTSSTNNAYVQLTELGNKKQYNKFIQQRMLMAQLLPPRCLQDIDKILDIHKTITSIFMGMNQIVNQDVFKQIFKRQRIYYTRFYEEIDKIEKLNLNNLSPNQQADVFKNLQTKQKKYMIEQTEWKRELDYRLKEAINRIQQQFLNKQNSLKTGQKADKKSELFSQKNFQILKLTFFQPNKVLGPFERCAYITQYQRITKSDRINNLISQFQTDKNLEPDSNKNIQIRPSEQRTLKRVKTSSCCGLFHKKQKQAEKRQQQIQIQKIKKGRKIQSYSCALKDGFLLFQGKITLYVDYLRFKSSFNPNTFFGATDIFIPKNDIYQIIRGRHIMSEMITIVTKRGSIQFTSFFSNPFDILYEVYLQNRNTEYEVLTHQLREGKKQGNMLQNKSEPPDQLQQLREKMKTQFVSLAQKQQFQINNVKVQDYQKMIQIQYHYFDISNLKKQPAISSSYLSPLQPQPQKPSIQIPMTFRVTVKHYENSLQYIFWHCQNQTLERKKKLQSIAKNVINEDRIQKVDLINKQKQVQRELQNRGRNVDDNVSFNISEQLSVIGGKEPHRIDLGEFDVPLGFGNKTFNGKKHISNLDLHMIMQQHETKISFQNDSPKHLGNKDEQYRNLQKKKSLKLLKQIQEENQRSHKNMEQQQIQIVLEPQPVQKSKKKININSPTSLKQISYKQSIRPQFKNIQSRQNQMIFSKQQEQANRTNSAIPTIIDLKKKVSKTNTIYANKNANLNASVSSNASTVKYNNTDRNLDRQRGLTPKSTKMGKNDTVAGVNNEAKPVQPVSNTETKGGSQQQLLKNEGLKNIIILIAIAYGLISIISYFL